MRTSLRSRSYCLKFILAIAISSILPFSKTAEAGKNYYFSTSIGDDSRSPIQAQNPVTPWKSLNKLNSYFNNFLPGDSILLRRGDTFYGSIIVSKGGSNSLPIVIGAYGSGPKPIITAFQTIVGWTDLGGNIWESSATNCKSTLNMVTLDGEIQAVGRYPNNGVLNYESFTGSISITDNQLTNSPNWTGAEVVIRANPYNWLKYPISNHSSSVITYSGSSYTDLKSNFGYFIQRDPKTIDINGEWYLNPNSRKLQMYFSDNNPNAHIIRASTLDTLIYLNSYQNNRSYIKFVNLSIEGGNEANICINGTSTDNSVLNCISDYSGRLGIYTSGVENATITNCTINNSLSTGILHGGNNAVITNNIIIKSGIKFGMSQQIGGGCGIEIISGSGSLIQYNHVDSTGKHGIFLRGNNNLVKNNLVEYAALTHDDVGGIYTTGTYINSSIIENIILNTKGNYTGCANTNISVEGIYLDAPHTGVYVAGNTVAHSGRGGLRYHNAWNVTARFNTLYDNPVNIMIVKSALGSSYSYNQTINNNISVCKNADQLAFWIYNYFDGDPLTFGTSDSNYFARPLLDTNPIRTTKPGNDKLYTLLQWQTASGEDFHSHKSPITITNNNDILFEYNASQTNKIVQLNGTYIAVDSSFYSGSITLLPYTSIVLIKVPGNNNNQLPSIQNQGFQLFENSPNGTTIGIVVASDPDAGQSLSYSIIAGNTSGAFALNPNTGLLTVANSLAVNFETTPAFPLVIKVQDNGMGNLSSQATITVTLIDVNEVPIISNQSFEVAENSANGSYVGMVVAADPDAGQTKTFSILSGNTNGAFVIHPLTGILTVTNSTALNFETTLSIAIVVKVQDNGAGNLSSQATVTVTLIDVNEPPGINNQLFSITENLPNGSNVGTVIAIDPDAGQTKTFSIVSGNTNAAFSINASSGILTVANSSALNFEVATSFALVIKVQDNGAGNLSSQAAITVSLTDVNESPVINNQSFSIAENSLNGSNVGTVVAVDPDAGQTKTFSILSGNINDAFAMNASSGILTVANSSALNFEVSSSFALVIKVQDNGAGNLSSQATITVTLLDLNEAPIVNNQVFNVQEYAANGTSVGIVIASDQDAGQTLSYSIISGNVNNAFTINTSSGTLTVNNSTQLNYSANPSFSLNIKVTDNGIGNLFDEATMTVNVIQSANQPPIIDNQFFSCTENSANGSIVGTVAASDPDAGQMLEYSILSGNTNGAFLINSSTGAISVINSTALDFETNPVFNMVIMVQDDGIGGFSSQANINVTLLDVNEVPIIISQSFSIDENPANGSTAGIVLASDPDAGQIKTFSILSGNINEAFAIQPLTGALTVANSSAVNFETVPSFALIVEVQDNGSGNLSNQATVTVTIADVNEVPIINNQAFSVAENSPNESNVGTVIAIDPDAGQVLLYTIISGNASGAFSINALTGIVKVANSMALDFEITTSFSLVIKVEDNGLGNFSSQATVTITLIDANEFPVINNQSFSIAENSPNGSNVGTVVAVDPDAGQTKTFSIESGNTNSAFTINASSGILTVANSSVFNFEVSPSFTLLIKVQDNGAGNLSSQAIITISLLDLNEAPILTNQAFSVLEYAANGTSVGIVSATDPDAGQVLSYSLISGNINNAFSVNASSGEVYVTNSTALNFGVNPTFSLLIRGTDDGTGNLFDEATISINVLQYTNQPPIISDQDFTIDENSANGTTAGAVIASDPNPGQVITYSILSGNSGGVFYINPLTGILTVTNSVLIDFEATPVFSLIVNVQDNGIGNLSNQATITVSLLDINEAPIISNQLFSVVENSLNGTIVGSVVSVDPDAGQTSSFSILSGNTNGTFAINASNGVITVANSTGLNFENTQAHTLVIKVQDNGTGNLSNQANVTISVVNINEPPLVSNQSFYVNENSPNGTIVGTFSASDPDAGQAIAYSILSGNLNNDFLINATTGVITVANTSALNYEVIASFSLIINVQDNGTGNLNSQGIANISLVDLNEPPSISNQVFSINENSSNGTIIGNVLATDPDSGQTTTFSILSGNTGGTFTINATTGILSVANSGLLDFESVQSFSLLVKVQDNGLGNLSSQAIVIVSLNDVNEAPIIYNQFFAIAENSANEAYVGTIIATDLDAGQILTYSILSGNTYGTFSINASTGLLSVANSNALNHEATPNFNLIVEVQDNGTGNLSNQSVIIVEVLDVNEVPVVNNQLFSVDEFSANGTVAGNVQATDPDEEQILSYEITSGNTDNAFMISTSTGMINVTNSTALNFLINPVFVLSVRVTDNGTGNLFDDASITINVLPVINQPPTIVDQTFSLNENSPNGTIVGTIEASDPNSGQSIGYSIIDGNSAGTFAINPSTGELTVSNSAYIDFETNPSFTLVIRVLDNGDPNLSSQAIITISLVDIDEPPIITDQSLTTPEHQSIGTPVGIVMASDPDSGKPVTFSITAGNTGNGFILNSVSGLLTINNPNAVCFEGNPLFNLSIKAIDNEGFSSEAAISIDITDINENPVCNNQYFTIPENAPTQTIIGNVLANDPDNNQTLAYSIISGNLNNAFTINANSGLLKVNNALVLNFEENTKYILTVSVQDNGMGNLVANSTITVELTDVNEPPVFENQVFDVMENSPPGTEIGFLAASDPENGQVLTYSIVAGNENGTFSLDAVSGLLRVVDPSLLVFGLNPGFTLMVKVVDAGSDSLSAFAFVTINLLKESSGLIVYIDPTNESDPVENGSLTHPFDSWEDITFSDGHTYLQKRGTTFKAKNTIFIQKAGITLDAYGSGSNPIIYYTAPFEHAIELYNSENCLVKNLDISFDSEGVACLNITGDLSKNLTIENCQLHNAQFGIRSSAQIKDLKILNTTIFNTGLDGILADNFESILVGKCDIYDVNQKWYTDQNASGTCIKLDSDNGKVYIYESEFDHSATGNTFAVQLTGTFMDGLFENNILKGRKISGNHCLGLSNISGTYIVRHNTFANGATGINSNAESGQIYYNQLIGNTVAIKVQQNKSVNVMNNTFYSNEDYSIESKSGSKVISKNNIYYLTPAANKAYNFGGAFVSDFNVFNVEKSGFLNGYSTLSVWSDLTGQDQNSLVTDPIFVDITTGNFRIRPNSPCINKGSELGLEKDFFATLVPQAGIPDIGFCEIEAENILPGAETIPVSEDKNLIDISVFPNPTKSFVKIRFEKTNDQPVNIKIFNLSGYEVYANDLINQEEVSINLEEEKPGLYMAVLTIEGQIYSRRILLQN